MPHQILIPTLIVMAVLQPIQTYAADSFVELFNRGHLKGTVEYYRQNPERNYALNLLNDTPDGKPPEPDEMPQRALRFVENRWKDWARIARNEKPEWQTVEHEFADLAKLSYELKYQLDSTFQRTRYFFYWWFQQPESLQRPDLILSTLDNMDPGSPLYVTLVRASMADSQWRTRQWFLQLLAHPQTFFALAPSLGTLELMDESDLFERVVNLPEYAQYPHLFWESLIPHFLSAQNPQWVTSRITSLSLAKLFLPLAANAPLWRMLQPAAITNALRMLCDVRAGDRKEVATQLLIRADSVNHPEWLKMLIETDRYDYLTQPLNQILALDHWYNDRYLRFILHGNPPTVEGLRKAAWVGLEVQTSATPEAVCQTPIFKH